MIFIVLGMHKSGTTLVARTLHESGIIMGQEFPQNADYRTSKFEARWAQDINDSMLGASRDMLSLNVTSSLLTENSISADVKSLMTDGITEMENHYSNWGFKDPRTSLTYKYWRDVLPPHRLIVIYRNPVEVWRRYSKVNRRWLSCKALKVWADYNRKILDELETLPRENYLILKFENFLSGDDEIKKLSQFVGMELVDIRDPLQSKYRITEKQQQFVGYKLLNILAGEDVRVVYDRLEALRGC